MIRSTLGRWRRDTLSASRQFRLRLQGRPDAALAEAIRQVPSGQRAGIVPDDLSPRDGWHSWDPTPWAHPWLTASHLRAARSFGQEMIGGLSKQYGTEPAPGRFGFVGNLANNMTLRALPLRERGVPITLYLHPSDRYVMSQPGWEVSDVVLDSAEASVEGLAQRGIALPDVGDVITLAEQIDDWPQTLLMAKDTPATHWPPPGAPAFARQLDVLTWPSYFSFLPALEQLQACSALFAAQTPYLAYLSGRPYLAAQTGGDLWLEASRQDAFGTLQRQAYRRATAILATNPWAYANARRFGFRHVLYVPLIIDTTAYSPGPRALRASWQQEIGGNFFALVTARLDRKWKGSHVGLDGFTSFAASHPDARLVVIGWGEHTQELIAELDRCGLQGRYLRVPAAGKRTVIEYLRAADCVIDQFVIGYYGATALEAMATGTPVVMKLAREQYDALCPTGAPPVLHASTAADVARQLTELAASEEYRAAVSADSREWVIRNHGVDVWRDAYVSLLNATASGARLDFSASPLAAPLDPAERDYHEAGLRAAPAFPSYDI